ncbi:glycosyltransferase [Microvirga terrestris]|uniref:Glycosyltransferase n=1 Tax=Microvirga terrestris TaxID=2791024 RepID=A0ABS0HVI5_9HYPH|nr:glycosyltransferase [Microvirga terrestris]MBF9197509.1 glycosyltransferase [Microvirga terrestris]
MIETLFHASIILNIHCEAVFLRRTLLSLDEAVRFAQSKGLRLELVAVLDRTDDATREVLSSFDLGSYQGVQIIEVDHGSLGLSRNAGIERARGDYVFTADADDLVSYNYFHDIYVAAERLGSEALYFPEYVIGFGFHSFVCRYEPLINVTPMTFLQQNPYISRVCAHRDVFRRIPFRDVRLSPGYAFEDWHFNAEAVASGLDIRIVEDVALFYRQRPGSLFRSAYAISVRQIPPTRLFDPVSYLKISEPFYNHLAHSNCNDAGSSAIARDFLNGKILQDLAKHANAIDPSIVLSRYRDERIPAIRNHTGFSPLGAAYYDICQVLGNHVYSDVFLFPFMSRGGAEKYFAALMEAISRIDPFCNLLAILGGDLDIVQWMDRLPPNVTIVDMSLYGRGLNRDQRCLLALKIVESCGFEARIHLRECPFVDRFLQLYSAVLKDKETIFYRFNDVVRIEKGRFITVGSSMGHISEHLDSLSKIICDSASMISHDMHRVGTQTQKWHHLPASIEAPAVLPARTSDAQHRILWASRLDADKRPSLLPAIARELHRVAPQMTIDVFGSSVLEAFDARQFEGLSNLRYHGSYAGFESLPTSRYSILLYTSLQDGVPNVLLEAMSHGLAVVAPDLGGISEIINNEETGILLPSLPDDDDMAASYAEALLRLVSDPDLCLRLGQQARTFVKEHHSPEAHETRVAELFQLQQGHFQHA